MSSSCSFLLEGLGEMIGMIFDTTVFYFCRGGDFECEFGG